VTVAATPWGSGFKWARCHETDVSVVAGKGMHAQNSFGCYESKWKSERYNTTVGDVINADKTELAHTFGVRNFMSLQKAHMKVIRRESMSVECPAPGITPCRVVASNLLCSHYHAWPKEEKISVDDITNRPLRGWTSHPLLPSSLLLKCWFVTNVGPPLVSISKIKLPMTYWLTCSHRQKKPLKLSDYGPAIE
jgi:hypothetical protein